MLYQFLMLRLFRYYKLLTWYSPRKIRHKCGWKSTEIIIQHSGIDSNSENFFANICLFRLYSLTGAEIVSIINHAVISTANDDRNRLTAEDLNKARDKVCMYTQLLSIEFFEYDELDVQDCVSQTLTYYKLSVLKIGMPLLSSTQTLASFCVGPLYWSKQYLHYIMQDKKLENKSQIKYVQYYMKALFVSFLTQV